MAKTPEGMITANTIEQMADALDAKLGKTKGHSFQQLIQMAEELAEIERKAEAQNG